MLIYHDMNYTPGKGTRTLHIWLPDDYYESDERYPVMYMFDGHNLFLDEHATYGKSWGLTGFLPSWGKKMIVVGMECSHEGNDRLSEYCPYEYSGRFFGEIKGLGHETFLWLVNEVKPWADSTLRTYSFREACGIGGSSMGGLMALYGIVRFNEVFSKAACVSSAVGPGMKKIEEEIVKAPLLPDTRVYLSFGTEEARYRASSANRLLTRTAKNHYEIEGLLRQRGCTASLYIQDGGRHCEADWEKQVPGFMKFLWDGESLDPSL